MSILLVDGLNLAAIMATADTPRGPRRDIGDSGAANDGSLRVTRQTRKRDLSFKSIPLSDADAHVWESLLIGEGEAFSWDSTFYGSKGTGVNTVLFDGVTLESSTPSPKFGAKYARWNNLDNRVDYDGVFTNLFGRTSEWSWMVWLYESAVWKHYMFRSDAAIWVNGVRNDSATFPLIIDTTGGTLQLRAPDPLPAAVNLDDLVTFPFKVLDSWPAIFAARTSAFPPLPYLDLTGDQITEQTARRVKGDVDDEISKTAAGVRHALQVELRAK